MPQPYVIKIFFSFLSILFFTAYVVNAQRIPSPHQKNQIYQDIESHYTPSKCTKFMHKIINKSVVYATPKKKYKKKRQQKTYDAFNGKIIRFVKIETLDPFGNTIADTILSSQNILTVTGNKTHKKTQKSTISNLLLIRENQIFDSLLVKESERLIRSCNYVQDVSFYVKSTTEYSDSVDIFIRVLDKWSITGQFSNNNTRMIIGVHEKNFLGYGHQFQSEYIRFRTDSSNAFNTGYNISNISNTYINAFLYCGTNTYGISEKSITIDRSLFSPLTNWAGGVQFSQHYKMDSVWINNTTLDLQEVKWNTQDYWAAHAFRLYKGNSEHQRQTKLVSAARFLNIKYLDIPSGVIDTPFQFADKKFYLFSLGVSTRKYIQDTYILDFGLTEDVPIGKVYSLTAGYQTRNNEMRLYLGCKASFGQYFAWGYLSSTLEYGTFINKSHTEQSVISVGANYFSELFEIGKWRFRQFLKPQLIWGNKRLPYEKLNLNNNGYDVLTSTGLYGSSRLTFELQTHAYAPWNILGFRFGPYLSCSFGMLGNEYTGFKKSNVYSQFGLGVLIKNENLIINTFQFSFSFYPLMPGTGQNVFKVNAFKTNDFGYRNFEIGKPTTVQFQ